MLFRFSLVFARKQAQNLQTHSNNKRNLCNSVPPWSALPPRLPLSPRLVEQGFPFGDKSSWRVDVFLAKTADATVVSFTQLPTPLAVPTYAAIAVVVVVVVTHTHIENMATVAT